MRRPRTRPALLLYLVLPLILFSLSGWTDLSSNSGQLSPQPSVLSPQQSDPAITEILKAVSKDDFTDIVGGLSGAHPVTIGGQPVTFVTRYTPSAQGTLSEQYVYEYFQSLGLSTQYHTWNGTITRCLGISGRNVVAEIPGKTNPKRIYLITSHLDSISPNPLTGAPGADDDGSGTAAVMMVAKILRSYSFDNTLRFVTFTGEERGLCGSDSYARDARARNDDIRGVLNLDMIAWDSNGVRDVEIHAGTRPDSQELANLLSANAKQYSPTLVSHIYKEDATNLSDHSSFWGYGYPALAFAEYIFHGDVNPYIHSVLCCDTVDHLDPEMAAEMMRAAFATFATLGGVRSGPGIAVTPTAIPPTSVPVPTVALPGVGSRAFPETGKSVSGLFLDYWQQNGGLAQQGYPISEVMGEISDLDKKPYTIQYFERAVFEYHPEKSAPFNVLLSQLGTFAYKQKYPNGAPNQNASTSPGTVLFPETGKRLGGKFLDYWQRNGGLAQQGFPISEEFTEVSPLNGKPYLVQYFERAVFEYHPEVSDPKYEVLLSQLGTFRYKQKYP
jgi:hypothetical protein